MAVIITINIFGETAPKHHHKETFNKEILTVATQATSDQKIEQKFGAADQDKVPVGAALPPVTVTFQDADGNDLSKWITATPDATDPTLFSYTRNSDDDGSQPPQIDFFAIGTVTVNGQAETVKSSLSFVPGAPAGLTATTTVVPLASAGS